MTNISGPMLLSPKTFADLRGYFRESYQKKQLAEILGFEIDFVQDNDSFSKEIGVLRGLHFQRPPHAQAKLVKVVSGAIFDVIVDLRADSTTYGHWQSFELCAQKGQQLFVPVGFAHGFCTLSENTTVSYKISDYYAPECEGGVIWNDKQLAIDWPLKKPPIISEKDDKLISFGDLGQIF
ncbi:MAG: dTDP-4-dehydrorhamnose 3,5-epimerase [Candidatus Adiutrix sp.]